MLKLELGDERHYHVTPQRQSGHFNCSLDDGFFCRIVEIRRYKPAALKSYVSLPQVRTIWKEIFDALSQIPSFLPTEFRVLGATLQKILRNRIKPKVHLFIHHAIRFSLDFDASIVIMMGYGLETSSPSELCSGQERTGLGGRFSRRRSMEATTSRRRWMAEADIQRTTRASISPSRLCRWSLYYPIVNL